MDSCEATRVVYSRIQNLDPENASKTIGLLLMRDQGENEMIHLASGPESLLHSVIFKARKELGISLSTPSSPFPFSPSLSRHNSSPRIINGISNLPSPLIIQNPSSSWTSSSNLSDFQHPEDLISPGNHSKNCGLPGSSNLGQPFYRGGGGREANVMDDFHLQDQLSYLNNGSPLLGPKGPDFFHPCQPDLASSPSYGSAGWHGGPHRRSFSVNNICLGGGDDPAIGFGGKPCLHYARGCCKSGTSCRFVHDGSLVDSDGAAMVGSPSELEVMEQCQEMFGTKSAHQYRLAAASQLIGGSSSYSPKKCMNHIFRQQQNDSPRAATLMMEEEMNRFGRNRNEFSKGMGMVNPSSRQIYMTFQADCTFKEEDVSNYFSNYGPVLDVRIPYQQKRMFGFVTFVYPETVKLILAKGNPHFICDARILVKPYKEKGNVPDKFRQQMEMGEYLSCRSPTSFDSRDPFDIQFGEQMLWRRKLEEQANLEQAIELQNRRLMSLQFLDEKRNHHHCALSASAAIPSPTHSPTILSHSSFFHFNSDRSSPEDDHQTVDGLEKEREKEKKSSDFIVKEEEGKRNSSGNGKSSPLHEESDFQGSVEHNLPDSLFASPTP